MKELLHLFKMISNQELKQKLLMSDMFLDNLSFDRYIELIIKNLNTPLKRDETQKHHIIPKHYFNHRDIEVDDSKDNIINLPIPDHIRAHYYLYNCMKDNKEAYSNLYALRKMVGGKFSDLSKIENLDDEECLTLYKNYIEGNRQAHIGKSYETSQETRDKISAANKGKYHDYKSIHDEEGNEKRVPESELQYYLDGGWLLGRSENSINGLKNGYNYNSKGMLGKKQSDFQKEQVRKAMLGKSKSLDARNNMSIGKAGKFLFINPVTGKGKYISEDEVEEYIKLGWYKKKKQ